MDFAATSEGEWAVKVEHAALAQPASISFKIDSGRPTFQWVGMEPRIQVIRDEKEISLMDYLSHYPLAFYLEDFSHLEGTTVFYNRNAKEIKIDANCLQKLDWQGAGVNIQAEFPNGTMDYANPKTVQELLGKELVQSNEKIVFYDHGSGEMADFLTLDEGHDNTLLIKLYHCKGAGGATAGDRVGDAYEVCGQVVKCLVWLKTKHTLRARMMAREAAGNSRLLKGARTELLRLLSDEGPKKLTFEIYVIQPGISIGNISDKIGHILGAAADYVRRACGAKMLLIGS